MRDLVYLSIYYFVLSCVSKRCSLCYSQLKRSHFVSNLCLTLAMPIYLNVCHRLCELDFGMLIISSRYLCCTCRKLIICLVIALSLVCCSFLALFMVVITCTPSLDLHYYRSRHCSKKSLIKQRFSICTE